MRRTGRGVTTRDRVHLTWLAGTIEIGFYREKPIKLVVSPGDDGGEIASGKNLGGQIRGK